MIIGPECRTCKFCIGTVENDGIRYYICKICEETNLIEEWFAEDPELDCDAYVEDSDDNITA